MEVKDLVPVDYLNQRVLLTAQVAEVYGTSPARIRDNFKRAKKNFEEGVHYFKLEGEPLRDLREKAMCVLKTYAPSPIPQGCRSLTLWTQEGCARHCKMLNTPKAWEMFDKLEKHYFNPATHVAPPAETPLSAEEPVKKTLKPLVPVAVVYAVLFANMLVKIGVTGDFYRRLKELRKETNQDIVEFITTPFKPLDDARLLELTLKAKFFACPVTGEFFKVDFEIVKAALVATPADKLLEIAREMPNPDEKTKILLQAANLINGKKIF